MGLAENDDMIQALATDRSDRPLAKAAGVHMGRPPKLTRHQQRQALARRDAGETLMEIARTYDVSHMTIARLKPSLAASE